MTVPDDLSSLITSLERVLWEGQLSDKPEVSALLERVRHYLIVRQSCASQENYEATAEKLTQVLLNRLETRITDGFQPLQRELESLQDHRQSLWQETQALEQQRQQMFADFLQQLRNRCDEVLQQQLSVAQGENTTLNMVSPQASQELVYSLNSTFKTVFDGLVQDLQAYSDSLTDGIERMHSLGQQGEAKFLAYFNRLQQQLELSLHQLTLPSSNPIQTAKNWYLALDLTAKAFNGTLFAVDSHQGQLLTMYPLSQEVNPDATDSNLSNPQQRLIALRDGLTHQETSFIPELTQESLEAILSQLKNVILVCPLMWNEGDRAQLQSVILETNWVATPEDILWVPPSIILTLAYFPLEEKDISGKLSLTSQYYSISDVKSWNIPPNPSSKGGNIKGGWGDRTLTEQYGLTSLVINIGETVTELSLVEIPELFSSLTTQELAYGRQALDQDILCQLIYPQWSAQITQNLPNLLQPFPNPGQPDLSQRAALKQQLQVHPLGNSLLEAAQLTRMILQQQDTFTSTLSQQSWGVTRQSMREQVLNPWLIQLNQAINQLLVQGVKLPGQIGQIIATGEGISGIEYGLSPWFKEKFPQANFILDKSEETETSMVQGLTRLPFFLSN